VAVHGAAALQAFEHVDVVDGAQAEVPFVDSACLAATAGSALEVERVVRSLT
jgi:hypothetical protein